MTAATPRCLPSTPDLEQLQVEHRHVDVQLDHEERDEEGGAADELEKHPRAESAHGVAAGGLQPVRDADQGHHQPGGEGAVAPPVDRGALLLSQLGVGPDRAEHPNGTLAQNTSRQSTSARRPPAMSPMKSQRSPPPSRCPCPVPVPGQGTRR